MSDNPANFIFTTTKKPSIFEIIAQKSLADTLYPAFHRLISFISSSSPKLHNFEKYYDEIFLFCDFLLQYHYLSNYDATFSECFYGLKRSLLNGKNLNTLKRDHSLMIAIILPYVKRKLDARVAIYHLQDIDGYLGQDLDSKFKRFLINLHRFINILLTIMQLFNYLNYMTDNTVFSTLTLRALRLTYIYDVTTTQTMIGRAFEAIAFFMQLLINWEKGHDLTALPTPTPPINDPKAHEYKRKCPICLRRWRTPTVIPISGYIYCFGCIVRHLQLEQKCPITGLPTGPLDLVRLNEN